MTLFVIGRNGGNVTFFPVPQGATAESFMAVLSERYPTAEFTTSTITLQSPRPKGRNRFPRRRPAWTRKRR